MNRKRPRAELRWLVRREPFRSPRFGESRRDVTAWAVRTVVHNSPNGRSLGKPVFFAELTMAHRYARTACETYYGRRTR